MPPDHLKAKTISDEEGTTVSTETTTDEPRKCRAVKNGRIDLHCTEPEGHDRLKEGGTWHKAVYVNRQQVDYDGAHHEIVQTETVTWEPVDHAAEAARHIMAASQRD